MKTYLLTEEVIRRFMAVGASEAFAKTNNVFNNQASHALSIDDVCDFGLEVAKQNWSRVAPTLRGYEYD